MAELNKPAPQGSRWGRIWREGVDRAFLGNRGFNYRHGTWDPKGVRQGLIQTGAGLVVPGGSTLAGLALNMYNRAGMNNTRRSVPNPGLNKPTSGFATPGGSYNPGASSGLSGVGSLGSGVYSGASSPGTVPGGPISIVPLTPEGNFRTTNPGISTAGMNLNQFSAARPVTGFSSGGYTPFGAGVITGDAAQGMWGAMQMSQFGNRQHHNAMF